MRPAPVTFLPWRHTVGIWSGTARFDTEAEAEVPHVELSLTELIQPAPTDVPSLERPAGPHPLQRWADAIPEPLRRWVDAVAEAAEPSLVLDSRGLVVAMSPSCVKMLGLSEPPVGEPLKGGPVRLIDFSSTPESLGDNEVGKIPPLLSLSSGRLARGLIRVDCDGTTCTVDAIATPIGEQNAVVGSFTFFSPV